MISPDRQHGSPSLRAMALVDALAFWFRRQALFWTLALPVAGFGAMVAYLFEARIEFDLMRDHWAWSFLFTVLYALFLDRWMKETLLDGDLLGDSDALRQSTLGARAISLAILTWLIVLASALGPYAELNVLACAAVAAMFVLVLPALAANESLGLSEAYTLGRPHRARIFLMVFGAMLLSLIAGLLLDRLAPLLPHRMWVPAALAAAQRLVDCVLLAFVRYDLAVLFRTRTDWQAPLPEGLDYSGVRIRARNA